MLDHTHRASPQKALLSFVLAIVLVVGLIPSEAFAEGATEKKEDSTSRLTKKPQKRNMMKRCSSGKQRKALRE